MWGKGQIALCSFLSSLVLLLLHYHKGLSNGYGKKKLSNDRSHLSNAYYVLGTTLTFYVKLIHLTLKKKKKTYDVYALLSSRTNKTHQFAVTIFSAHSIRIVLLLKA